MAVSEVLVCMSESIRVSSFRDAPLGAGPESMAPSEWRERWIPASLVSLAPRNDAGVTGRLERPRSCGLFPQHRSVPQRIDAKNGFEFFRRRRRHDRPLLIKSLSHLGQGHHFCDIVADLLEYLPGSPGRREQAEPCIVLELRHAGFAKGRHIGQAWHAYWSRDRQRADLPGLDERLAYDGR